MTPADATPAPAAGTPEPRCVECGATDTVLAAGSDGKLRCLRNPAKRRPARPAETPPAAEPRTHYLHVEHLSDEQLVVLFESDPKALTTGWEAVLLRVVKAERARAERAEAERDALVAGIRRVLDCPCLSGASCDELDTLRATLAGGGQ